MLNKSFFKEFRFFLILFQIFGLALNSDHRSIRCCLWVYSFLQILVCPIIFLFVIYLQIGIESALSTTVVYLSVLVIAVTHLIIALHTFLTHSKQLTLLKTVAAIDVMFQRKLKYSVCYAEEVRLIWLKLLGLIIATLLFRGYNVYIVQSMIHADYLYPCYYSELLIFFKQVQCLFFVFLLKNRLNLLQTNLLEIAADENSENDSHHEIIGSSENSFDKLLKYEQLLYFKRIYGKLYDINQLINDSFGWSLLAIFAKYFIDFTTNAYWLFISLCRSDVEYYLVVACICIMLLTLLLAIIFARACFACTKTVS